MKKTVFYAILLFAAASVILSNARPPAVHGSASNQTIPTRTPTPVPPTPTPSNGGNGGTNPTATNAATDPDAPTATSTLLPVNIAPTPVGGFLPTAVPCGSSPTIQTLGATNVRSGPGLDYEVIGELVFLEVRNIVGRAESAEWWLIQFNDGQLGWVANQVVSVQGYTPIVPIVEAPPRDGGTPTPGPAWDPTPIPFCTVTPQPTATQTAVPTNTAEATAELEMTPTLEPTESEASPTEARPTSTPILQATANVTNPTATAVPSDPPADDESGSLGLILLGLGAVLGAGLFILIRKQRG